MPTRYLCALDAGGAPITGLSPVFLSAFDSTTLIVAPLPTISEVGNGIYTFDSASSLTGLVDVDPGAGGGASPRYAFVRPELNNAFVVYDSSGEPQTGLAPTMVRRTASTGVSIAPIAIVELGDGVYGFAYPDPSETEVADIDTGGDAPAHLCLTVGLSTTTAPSVGNISPAAGTSITTFQAIAFDVTDPTGLNLVLVDVKFAAKRDRWVVYDGAQFSEMFEQGSTATAIANGLQFSVIPKGGWQDSIDEFFVYAVDGEGNVEALP